MVLMLCQFANAKIVKDLTLKSICIKSTTSVFDIICIGRALESLKKDFSFFSNSNCCLQGITLQQNFSETPCCILPTNDQHSDPGSHTSQSKPTRLAMYDMSGQAGGHAG